MNDPLLENAKRFHQAGNLAEAVRIYQQILKANPWHLEAIGSLALAHFQVDKFEEAQRLFGEMARLNPKAADAMCFRGVALLQLKRPAEALTTLDAALAVNPNFIEAMINRATALLDLHRLDEALAAFDAALAVAPGDPNAWNNRGNALLRLDRLSDAIASYEKALALEPRHADAWNNRGNTLAALGRYDEALASFTQSLNVRPGNPEAWAKRGGLLAARRQFAEAVASFDKAIAIRPEAGLYAGRAEALFSVGRIEDAIKDCETVLKRNPDFPLVRGNLAFWHLVCCDWRTLEAEKSEIARRLRLDQPVIDPFKNVTVSSSAADQLRSAQVWARGRYPRASRPIAPLPRHDKIRIAYLSADLRVHPTAYLLAGVFELHDRNRFETTAVSFGRREQTEMRSRLEHAFDRFIEADLNTDKEIADLLRDHEIDIAVDLKGYTTDARPEIFALRGAPVQVNYLGFPSTMGVDFIDYIVAERVVIPDGHREFYAEKIVYLPDSYQANDAKRKIAERRPTRAQAGLPETGFVFCSFNNSYKLNPQIFDIWMRLLKSVPGSILWLLETNPPALRNLRREAEARGVAAERLVFGPFMSMEEHLARLSLADLFLDTLPCNAHTTASDALWAGLPILTSIGTTFAGRVAASVLGAAGLPELITSSLEEYETAALRLAQDPATLAAIRSKLARTRDTCPLFDTARFCRHLEAAYVSMWKRYQRGEKPESFNVEP